MGSTKPQWLHFWRPFLLSKSASAGCPHIGWSARSEVVGGRRGDQAGSASCAVGGRRLATAIDLGPLRALGLGGSRARLGPERVPQRLNHDDYMGRTGMEPRFLRARAPLQLFETSDRFRQTCTATNCRSRSGQARGRRCGGCKANPMDDPKSGKTPTAEPRKLDPREARLAKALRANLRRRKSSDTSPEPPTRPAVSEDRD
jgi:hypothetical protein